MDDGSIGNISDRRDHQFSKLRSPNNEAGGAGRELKQYVLPSCSPSFSIMTFPLKQLIED